MFDIRTRTMKYLFHSFPTYRFWVFNFRLGLSTIFQFNKIIEDTEQTTTRACLLIY